MENIQIDTRALYNVVVKPVNRYQKRIAEKEFEKINKVMMPIIYGYLATCEESMGFENQEFKKLCITKFISAIPNAERGNNFIKVNRDFFARFIPPFSETLSVVETKKYENRQRIIAISIILFVVMMLIAIFVFKG